MKTRLHALVIAASIAAGGFFCAAPARAQDKGKAVPPSQAESVPRRDRVNNLDFLFEALKVAPDDTSAKAISDRISDIWLSAGGDTTNVLMTRVRSAVDSKDFDLALELLNAVIEFKPDYAEGWNERATVYYLKKDYGRAMGDLAQALSREPRHFGAMFGVGIILQEFGDERRALEIYRRVLQLNPHMERVPNLVKSLSEKIEGRDI